MPRTWGARQGWECVPSHGSIHHVGCHGRLVHGRGAILHPRPNSFSLGVRKRAPAPSWQLSPKAFARQGDNSICEGAGHAPPVEDQHLFASLGCSFFPTRSMLSPAALLPSPSPATTPTAAKIPGEDSCTMPCSISSGTRCCTDVFTSAGCPLPLPSGDTVVVLCG